MTVEMPRAVKHSYCGYRGRVHSLQDMGIHRFYTDKKLGCQGATDYSTMVSSDKTLE